MKKFEKNSKFFDEANKLNSASKSTNNAVSGSLKTARKSGYLNVSNRNLEAIPDEVFSIAENLAEDEKFWEIMPLSKIDLAHNKLRNIPDLFHLSLFDTLQILKIRENFIDHLPDSLFLCLKLRELDFAVNSITSISLLIGNLIELRILYIFRNRIKSLPQNIMNCRFLQVLDCSENQLNELPDDFFFPSMTQLNLKHNNLANIPISICHMKCLENLDISENQLNGHMDFANLICLKVLDLTQNKLIQFPILPVKGILDRVHIGYNRIEQINVKSLLSTQSILTELLIHNNKLTMIPPEISLCLKCKVIDVSNNDISDIPAAIGYMPSLQRFAVEGNPIRTIRRTLLVQSTEELKKYLKTRGPPLFLVEQTDDDDDNNNNNMTMQDNKSNHINYKNNDNQSLHMMDASNKSVIVNTSVLDYDTKESDFHKEILQRVRALQSNTGVIDLSHMNLINFPKTDIDTYLNQRYLSINQHVLQMNLSHNNINKIENCIYFNDMNGLQNLNLSNNQLGMTQSSQSHAQLHQQLPHHVQSFLPMSLRILDLSKNCLIIDDLELLIYSLNQLTDLNVSNNNLLNLPNNLSQCTELRDFKCTNNKIQTIDNIKFNDLLKLESIDISDNKLKSADVLCQGNNMNVNSKSKLKSINLKNNNIMHISYQFCYFPLLTYLGLHGNPQKVINSAIINNTDAILKCLRNKIPTSELLEENSKTNNECKNNDMNNHNNHQHHQINEFDTKVMNQFTSSSPSSSSVASSSLNDNTSRILINSRQSSSSRIPSRLYQQQQQQQQQNQALQQQQQQQKRESPSQSQDYLSSQSSSQYGINSNQYQEQQQQQKDHNNTSYSVRPPLQQHQYEHQQRLLHQKQQQDQQSILSMQSLKNEISTIERELETSVSISTTRKQQLKKQLASNKADLTRYINQNQNNNFY